METEAMSQRSHMETHMVRRGRATTTSASFITMNSEHLCGRLMDSLLTKTLSSLAKFFKKKALTVPSLSSKIAN
jgi:hypothetical protein